jgi:hypothetical protein
MILRTLLNSVAFNLSVSVHVGLASDVFTTHQTHYSTLSGPEKLVEVNLKMLARQDNSNVLDLQEKVYKKKWSSFKPNTHKKFKIL